NLELSRPGWIFSTCNTVQLKCRIEPSKRNCKWVFLKTKFYALGIKWSLKLQTRPGCSVSKDPFVGNRMKIVVSKFSSYPGISLVKKNVNTTIALPVD